MAGHATELSRGERFAFGENWSKYLDELTATRIAGASKSLQVMLGADDLTGKTFLDVGSGSGVFSLAARKLGATVHSFDYDPQSVACTRELRKRHFASDSGWTIEEGSVLDKSYLARLGTFDVVYSWGVLHHTGAMWEALKNVAPLVASGGQLALAIYNDQGRPSARWKFVKRAYCASPPVLRHVLLLGTFVRLWGPTTIRDALRGRIGATWRQYHLAHERGMSPWRDTVDWVGGYPFEVAKPEEIFDFFRERSFELSRLKTCGGGLGCNEYVFVRRNPPTEPKAQY